jgi:hypothetical protein
MSHSFPKIIWQTHNYLVDELPEYMNQICGTWINFNPGWQHIYVDHIQREAMVAQLSPELHAIYKEVIPMYQADIWRYLITYEHGGMYADMDSICVKPIDYMLEKMSQTSNIDPEIIVVPPVKDLSSVGQKSFTNNANYLIKKKSYIMKNIIDSLLIKKVRDKGGNVDCSCGRKHFTRNELPYYAEHSSLVDFQVAVNEAPKEDVDFTFSAALHDPRFKTSFEAAYNMSINSYGKGMFYSDFVTKNNLKYTYY